MRERLLTGSLIERFRKHLITEERSELTIEDPNGTPFLRYAATCRFPFSATARSVLPVFLGKRERLSTTFLIMLHSASVL